jgi:ABC-type siderophore export system fused ATPase/permease subunit
MLDSLVATVVAEMITTLAAVGLVPEGTERHHQTATVRVTVVRVCESTLLMAPISTTVEAVAAPAIQAAAVVAMVESVVEAAAATPTVEAVVMAAARQETLEATVEPEAVHPAVLGG